MKILYLDCSMGAAGDMLCSALWELVDDKEKTLEHIKSFLLPKLNVSFESKTSLGMIGTRALVTVNDEEEGSESNNIHHICTSLQDVRNIINSMKLDDNIKECAYNVYELIAQAEAKAHNTDNCAVHFHEVGMYDAITDVTLFCYLLDLLKVDRVYASPVNTGKGTVKCAHGILPVPAPATANLLCKIPCYSNDVDGELCTPTGAALLKMFVNEFTTMPKINIYKIGTGLGSKEFDRPNCLRAFLGVSAEDENVIELSCNIDDMTGEELAFAQERLMALGALDVTIVPIIMKKGRPAFELKLLCKPSDREQFCKYIFKYTTTLGIRHQGYFRYTLERKIQEYECEGSSFTVKISEGFNSIKEKVEYEDIKRFAIDNDMSFAKARKRLKKHIE